MCVCVWGGGGGGEYALHPRGGLVACPPRKVLNFRPSEITSVAISSIVLLCYVVWCLHKISLNEILLQNLSKLTNTFDTANMPLCHKCMF